MKESWSLYKTQHPRASEHSVLGLCILLGILFLYTAGIGFIYAAAAIILLALISKPFRNIIGIFWWGLARILHKTISPIILFIFFFFILTPWSFLFRLFHKDHLRLKGSHESQMTDVNHVFSEKDFKYPF